MNSDSPPAETRVVTITSTLDGAQEPGWFLPNPRTPAAPLLVHLHSWSGTYDGSAGVVELAHACAQRGWAFLSPNFRGPNNRPEAAGSRLAMQDVLDAVAYAQSTTPIDPARIYLLGGSGGGHMALMMAQLAPQQWTAVSSWVPVTDLAAWHAFSQTQGSGYDRMLENCCGGFPEDPMAREEYRRRSPLYHLARAVGLPINLQAGIHDGHGTAPVPVSNTLRAFNVLAAANGHHHQQFSDDDIAYITDRAELPDTLVSEPCDESDRLHRALFRRTGGPVTLTLYEGAHETDFPTALRWLERQQKG